jgi:hypothetical protein
VASITGSTHEISFPECKVAFWDPPKATLEPPERPSYQVGSKTTKIYEFQKM